MEEELRTNNALRVASQDPEMFAWDIKWFHKEAQAAKQTINNTDAELWASADRAPAPVSLSGCGRVEKRWTDGGTFDSLTLVLTSEGGLFNVEDMAMTYELASQYVPDLRGAAASAVTKEAYSHLSTFYKKLKGKSWNPRMFGFQNP